jgi:predicted glycosyltransferase
VGNKRSRPKVWIDIDNPPQVQYLLPFAEAFRSHGADVFITARDYGNALELLAQRTTAVRVVGGEFGGSKAAKVWGAASRARALISALRRERPTALLCSSRSSAIAARILRVPSFVIVDYEYANLSLFRFTHSTILHPDVVDVEALRAAGVPPERLVAFRGLKEDISLTGIDVAGVAPHEFPQITDERLVRVLFRPPSEKSHYYDPRSRALALQTLNHLARQSHAVVVFAPRHTWQLADLKRFAWANEPIVLERAVPFVSLLKGVDLVVCSGGTMLREAAYLGLPAYSILKSRIGGVDRYLASIGRATLITGPKELGELDLRKAPSPSLLSSNPHLLDELVSIVLHGSGKP